MQGELRLKGRFVARFTVGVSICEEEEDDNGVVVGQDHFQLTGEQISSSPLTDQVTKVSPSISPSLFDIAVEFAPGFNEGKLSFSRYSTDFFFLQFLTFKVR